MTSYKSSIGQNILSDQSENPYEFDAKMIQPNRFTHQIDQGLGRYGQESSQSLGVAQELRRFAMNEFLKKRDDQVLVGATMDAVEEDLIEDDLLLTNAITENIVQDTIDKTRYLKEVVSYVTINSAARLTSLDIIPPAIKGFPTLTSSGDTYVSSARLAPFSQLGSDAQVNRELRNQQVNIQSSDGSQNLSFGSTRDYTASQPPIDTTIDTTPFNIGFNPGSNLVVINSFNNRINFKLRNLQYDPPDVTGANSQPIFDFYLPVGSYTVSQFQQLLQSATDDQIPNVFTIHAFTSPLINPGYVNVDISTISVPPDDYVFTWDFNSPINAPTIAPPTIRADGSIVTPTTAPDGATFNVIASSGAVTYFPNPNNYIITLNKAMTNVKAIRLVSSEIPNTDTIINLDNNQIDFHLNASGVPVTDSSGSTDFQFFIDPGNYTVTQLANEIETQANILVMGESAEHYANVFKVTVDPIKGIFKINVNDPFSFQWAFNNDTTLAWRNMYHMLGFQNPTTENFDEENPSDFVTEFSNLILVNQGTAKNPFNSYIPFGAFNLRVSNIIWMYMNGFDCIYDSYTMNDYFAKFTLWKVQPNEIAYDTFNSSPMVFADAPLPSLSQLTISFVDEIGKPHNFNNVDHSFTLEFRHHLDRLQGTDYSSRRGVNDKTSYV